MNAASTPKERTSVTVFPALSVALIRLEQGDGPGAEAGYALAGPARSWNPIAAMRKSKGFGVEDA
jgi:hypothetical protein